MKLSQPMGYFSESSKSSGNPVLVLHAWWGLNDTIKTICDRLSQNGFIAFAPDLYHGTIADELVDAEDLSGALFDNIEQTRAEVIRAAKYLIEKADQDKGGLAVIGFSLGAFFALDLSINTPNLINSVVVFYGTSPGDFGSAKATYLGHFAENDEFEPQAAVDDLKQSLRLAGQQATFHQYKGTGHWFFEPDRLDSYNSDAAALAWERTLLFLSESFSS